jgi:hypothetical protein
VRRGDAEEQDDFGELAVPVPRVTIALSTAASAQVRTFGDDTLTERRQSIRIDPGESAPDFVA